MDTSEQVAVIPQGSEPAVASQRQRRSIADKRGIVKETWVDGASVARVARAHGVNANQVFGWRQLLLGRKTGTPEAGDKVAAGSGEWRCAGAFADGA
jgi:transposase